MFYCLIVCINYPISVYVILKSEAQLSDTADCIILSLKVITEYHVTHLHS